MIQGRSPDRDDEIVQCGEFMGIILVVSILAVWAIVTFAPYFPGW